MYRIFKSERLRITAGLDEAGLRENLNKGEGDEGAYDSLFVFRTGAMRLGGRLQVTEAFYPCHVIRLIPNQSGEWLMIKVTFPEDETWAGQYNPVKRQGILELQLPLLTRITGNRFIKPLLVRIRTRKLRRQLRFGRYRWRLCRKVLLDSDEGFDPIEGHIARGSYKLKGNRLEMKVEEEFEGRITQASATVWLSKVVSWRILPDGSLEINEVGWTTTLSKEKP